MDRSEKLIAAIIEQNIRPRPKWRFSLRDSLTSGAFLLAVLLGALAFSVVLFAIQQTDFSVISHLSHSGLELFLGLLPIFWIILLITALATAMYGIRNSSKGYKFTLARQMGYSAALSILLGALFFITGGAQRLEEAFSINVSLYESIQEKKMKLWMMPADGRLAGQIGKVGDDTFELTDFSGKHWTVRYDSAFIAPVVLLEEGEQIKLNGYLLDKKRQFMADDIRPWQWPGSRGQHGRPWPGGADH